MKVAHARKAAGHLVISEQLASGRSYSHSAKNSYRASGLFSIIFSILVHAQGGRGQIGYFPFIFSPSLRLLQYLATYFFKNFFIIIPQNANCNNNSINADYNSIFCSPVISGYMETFFNATLRNKKS